MSKKDTTNLAKKVAAVSDSTKTLSKEIKSMTKVFSDNQKVLTQMYQLISMGHSRKDISTSLNISVEFYDRFKNQRDAFYQYLDH